MNETILKNDDIFQHQNDAENYENKLKDEKYYNNDINSTKNIILYRNGDKYFPPKRFVVNKRYIRTWDSFLEELTKSVQPRSGAIRDIRTPFHGTRIRSLNDLTINGKYVAVPKGESMKLIDYTNIINVTSPLNNTKKESRRLKPLKSSRYHDIDKIESKIHQNLYSRGIVINVYKNGDAFTRAIKIVLNQFEQKHMNILVRAIEERVLLPSNRPIRRLYTMNGEIIKFAKDVQDSQFYVAASNEPYHNIKYGQYLPVIRGGKVPSSRHKIKYLNHSPTPVTNRILAEGNPHSEGTHQSERSNYNTDRRKHNATNYKQKRVAMKEDAAIRIQAAFRGYLTRKEIRTAQENYTIIPKTKYKYDSNKFRVKQENNEHKNKYSKEVSQQKYTNGSEVNQKQKESFTSKYKHEKKRQYNQFQSDQKELAASKIQAAFRGYILRKRYKNDIAKVPERKNNKEIIQDKKPKSEYKKENNNKEMAAVIIQAGFAAYKARNIFNKRIENLNKKQAAVKIQAAYRSFSSVEPLNKIDDSRRIEAAIKIQAGYRAFKTRKHLNKNDGNRRKNDAAIKIQAGFRAFKRRKHLNNNDNRKIKDDAIKIQAGYRAYKTRKHLNTNLNNETQIEASIKIQAAYRAYVTRKTLSNIEKDRKEKEAVLKIQSGFRGYKVRKIINNNDEIRRKKEAAIKLQSGYRGYKTRKQIKETKEIEIKEKAAIKIQSSYRGFHTRKMINNDLNARLHEKSAEEQALERNNAATKIQSAFKGFKTRKDDER